MHETADAISQGDLDPGLHSNARLNVGDLEIMAKILETKTADGSYDVAVFHKKRTLNPHHQRILELPQSSWTQKPQKKWPRPSSTLYRNKTSPSGG